MSYAQNDPSLGRPLMFPGQREARQRPAPLATEPPARLPFNPSQALPDVGRRHGGRNVAARKPDSPMWVRVVVAMGLLMIVTVLALWAAL